MRRLALSSLSLLLLLSLPARGELRFERLSEEPIIQPGFGGWYDQQAVRDPELTWDGNLYRLYYTGFDIVGVPRIALAVSEDMNRWSPVGVVLDQGEPGSFDEFGVANPSILVENDGYSLYYTGQSQDGNVIARTRSLDGMSFPGLGQQRLMVLKASGLPGSFDENQVSDPAVVQVGGAYWLYYHGRDDGPYRRIGRALSPDGESFIRVSGDAELGSTFGRGPHGFDDGGALEPFLWLEGGELRLAYTSLHY